MLFHRYGLAIGALLLCTTSAVFGAARFVTGANVELNDNVAIITVEFACQVEYLSHLPVNRGNRLLVHVDPTTICSGASPTIAKTREQYRPINADDARLLEIDYDGELAANPTLTFVFTDAVRYDVSYDGGRSRIIVRVQLDGAVPAPVARSGAAGVQVKRTPAPAQTYVINLSSSRTPHTTADKLLRNASPGLNVFESEVLLGGVTWYRLRLGTFTSSAAAQAELTALRATHPNAWIDRVEEGAAAPTDAVATNDIQDAYAPDPALASLGLDDVDVLMADARRAMVEGEISRSVQLYTKVLRAPNHDRHAEAQELLGLAREKNGQTAHAKAEYQRYLSLYPNQDGAMRVQQRLAALLATGRQADPNSMRATGTTGSSSTTTRTAPSEWRFNTFFSQYYRRDANQQNEEDEIVSQSALYSDVNFDARRRGARFDFSSRLSAGYRNDFLDEGQSAGNELRISYAYADLADAETGLRGRIGRQSRNTGGVLGRFDGLNLGYRITERVLLNTVAGQPVNSATDGLESERTFYGASVNYGPLFENLELGAFVVQQDIGGIEDRQAIGAEFRYFGDKQSLWGLIDFDTSYNELSSAYLQGSWRIGSRLTVSTSFDRRHSPYLSTGSAMIGQPVESFDELQVLFTEEEIRQLAMDRTPLTSSFTGAFSWSLSPRLQLSVDANQTTIEATPDSGGVAAMPESTYNYVSTTLVASSLFKEGDVSMLSMRYSESDSTEVTSFTLDSRFPIGARWRINPRLRVDLRHIVSDASDELLYTPGIRIQYRRSRKLRIELEAGKQFATRETLGADIDRESYFINVGYQAYF